MNSTFLYVAVGGATGAILRYLLGMAVAFPLGTLAVNVIGSFLMGLAFVVLAEEGLERWMPLVMTGVLGGFTTFSAFSLDVFKLYEAGRLGAAGGYVLASL
ncbi:MAG: fluoride efflux transporter CrcB [Paracoccaceae bacterium]